MYRFDFEAIGTSWQIDIFDQLTPLQLDKLNHKIQQRITEFDLNYSRFKENSLVTKMSHEKGTFLLPQDSQKMMEVYRKLYELTHGVFTPLIGQVLSDAGYDAAYSLKTKKMVPPKKWEEVMEFNNTELKILEPVLLDFGAGGKGYLIDLVGQVLVKEKVSSFCIDAGGDILYKNIQKSSEKMKIGLENPSNLDQVIGIANLFNQSICGSAGNRRAWGNFHHMIDPRTLTSPRGIVASWVVADEALIADAIATALFFVPSASLENDFDFTYVVLHANFSIEKSPDFSGEFFYNG